jgi:hypothetical protein
MQEFGEEKLALEAFRRALAVNPHLQKIPDFVKTLTEKVEGPGYLDRLSSRASAARPGIHRSTSSDGVSWVPARAMLRIAWPG